MKSSRSNVTGRKVKPTEKIAIFRRARAEGIKGTRAERMGLSFLSPTECYFFALDPQNCAESDKFGQKINKMAIFGFMKQNFEILMKCKVVP